MINVDLIKFVVGVIMLIETFKNGKTNILISAEGAIPIAKW